MLGGSESNSIPKVYVRQQHDEGKWDPYISCTYFFFLIFKVSPNNQLENQTEIK